MSDGIFYYEGTDSYFPVRNIEIVYHTGDVGRVWHYEYDFEKEAYHNIGVTVEQEQVKAADREDEVTNKKALVY